MLSMTNIADPEGSSNRVQYFIQELRCAALRARLWQADIEAVGVALKGGLVTPEQATKMLDERGCLQLISPLEAS
jgi:hypothetical protein